MVQNYCAEQKTWASAFVLRDDDDIYYWLICSLLESIDRLGNATVIPETTGSQLVRDFNQLWQSIAKKFGLSKSSPEDVLNELCSLIQNQNIIMVVKQIHKAERVLPAFREEFWLALLDKMKTYSATSFIHGSFTLFMIAPSNLNKMSQNDWKTYSFHNMNMLEDYPEDFLHCPVELQEVSEICNSDVEQWLRRDAVREFLEKQLDCQYISASTQMLNELSDGAPCVVLHDLCGKLGFQSGLTDVESIWSSSFEEVA